MTVFNVGDRVVWIGKAAMGNGLFRDREPQKLGELGTVVFIARERTDMQVDWDNKEPRYSGWVLQDNWEHVAINENEVFIEGDDEDDCI